MKDEKNNKYTMEELKKIFDIPNKYKEYHEENEECQEDDEENQEKEHINNSITDSYESDMYIANDMEIKEIYSICQSCGIKFKAKALYQKRSFGNEWRIPWNCQECVKEHRADRESIRKKRDLDAEDKRRKLERESFYDKVNTYQFICNKCKNEAEIDCSFSEMIKKTFYPHKIGDTSCGGNVYARLKPKY